MGVRLLVAAAILVSSAAVSAASTIKPLLLMAIEAPDGKAKGELVGEVAQKFRNTTGSISPVMAEVTTLQHFSEGCKRLNLRLWQDDVQTERGRTAFAIDYGLNLCRDGMPPLEP